MKFQPKKYFQFSIVLLSILSFACLSSTKLFIKESENPEKIPLYRKATVIDLTTEDENKLKNDYFGYEQTLYPNQIDVRVTKETARNIVDQLEKEFIKDNWRYQLFGQYDTWQKGDHIAYLVIIDNLTTATANQFQRLYGMAKLEPSQTLIITYLFDSSAPKPNPSLTAAEIGRVMTATAEIIQQTEEAKSATQQSIDAATQIAVEATLKVESIKQTAVVLQPILEQLGTEFFEEGAIPEGMYIAREDPTRWDLTSKPGWLHIIGRKVSFSDENWIPKNVFVYPIQYKNVSIITCLDGNFNSNSQNIWIALSPGTYENDAYSIEFGISVDSDNERTIYANGCFKETCSGWFGYWDQAFTFEDQIRFPGPVFLRMDILEDSYAFYFSQSEEDWIFLGEMEGYQAGTNLILATGNNGYYDTEFDAYFDFLKIKPLILE